jgi:hypothetical protein
MSFAGSSDSESNSLHATAIWVLGCLLTDELVATVVSSSVAHAVFPADIGDCVLPLDAKAEARLSLSLSSF